METISLINTIEHITAHPIATGVAIFFIFSLALSLYRLTLHPLAKFPGPKLAGATYWYETYYDVYRQGSYAEAIIQLHKTYGPIIRINPNELHVSDPSFIEVLYTSAGKKREVLPWHIRPFQLEGSHFGTTDHDLHRMRRAPLSRFFSKTRVIKLEPVIKDKAVQYCRNLETWAGTGEPLDLVTSISCFTTDVVTEYLYADGYRFLDDPRMEHSLYHPIHKGAESVIPFRHFPIYIQLFNAIPAPIMKRLSADAEMWRLFRADARTRIAQISDAVRMNSAKLPTSPTTGFHELLASDMPESEKSVERMTKEAQAMVGAGIETGTWTHSVAMFHLLSTPETMGRLRAELAAVIPTSDPNAIPPWTTLEKLPYLSACIQEALRLSYGMASRLARSSPDEPIVYNGPDRAWIIPPHFSVGMSSCQIHHDETLFPDSKKYKPERWLDENGERSRQLEQYLLSFSKGSRQCLGMNLAYAELFILLAMLVRCYSHRFELYETTIVDVELHHDAMIPAVKPGSKGVRVLVK